MNTQLDEAALEKAVKAATEVFVRYHPMSTVVDAAITAYLEAVTREERRAENPTGAQETGAGRTETTREAAPEVVDVEILARKLFPEDFEHWERNFLYRRNEGGSEEEARSFAEWCDGQKHSRTTLKYARDIAARAIAALTPSPQPQMAGDVDKVEVEKMLKYLRDMREQKAYRGMVMAGFFGNWHELIEKLGANALSTLPAARELSEERAVEIMVDAYDEGVRESGGDSCFNCGMEAAYRALKKAERQHATITEKAK